MLSRKLPFLLELVLLYSSELKLGAMMDQRSGREKSTGLACGKHTNIIRRQKGKLLLKPPLPKRAKSCMFLLENHAVAS